MNFFGVLKKFGAVLIGVEHAVAPVISVLEPQLAPAISKLDNWLNRLTNGVVMVEATITQAQAGGIKQDAIINDFQNGIADFQYGLSLVGKSLQYDPDELKGVIDAFAAAYNKAATFKTHWKIVDVAPAAVPAVTSATVAAVTVPKT